MSTTNRYTAKAAFLFPNDAVLPAYERLFSRKLVASAISKYNVSRWADHDRRGLYEMYDESPFDITLISMPPDWQDIKHPIRLLSEDRFEITFKTPNGDARFEGEFGVTEQLGPVKMVANRVLPWNKKMAEFNYYITFNSLQALIDRFLRNLSVIQLGENPNRVTLNYTDAHPHLALNILGDYVYAYLEENERERQAHFDALLQEVETELKVLEAQILALDAPEAYLKEIIEAGRQLPAKDSSALQLLRTRLETYQLTQRLNTLERFLAGALSWSELKSGWTAFKEINDTFMDVPTSWNDISLNDNLSQRIVVDSMRAQIKARLQQLDEQSNHLNLQYLSVHAFEKAWEKQWLQKGGTFGQELLLRDKYLSALEQSAQLELEIRQKVVGPQLIDPPYLLPTEGRFLRIRVLVVSLAIVFLLAMGTVLGLAMTDKRFRSPVQFYMLSGNMDFLAQLGSTPLEKRRNVARMELSWGEDQQLLAFFGDSNEASGFALEMAASLAAIGKKVVVVNAATAVKEANFDLLAVPATSTSEWWFSAEAGIFLQLQTEKYERVLICLPPPHQEPEVLAALRLANLIYVVVRKDQTRIQDWKDWKTEADALGIELRPVWVG